MSKSTTRSGQQPSLAQLQQAAKAAAAKAYAPYSGFRVGAAIWTDKGLFTGANVENASYGLTNCAERTAIFAAAAAGARRLTCVVVYTPTPQPTAPCGACRQVIFEFGGPEARVVSCCDGDAVIDTTCDALLPGAFGPADLGINPADYGVEGEPEAAAASRKTASKRSKKTS
jgi:cytidine deaminase